MLISALVLVFKVYIAWKVLSFVCKCMLFGGSTNLATYSKGYSTQSESLYTDTYYWQDQDDARRRDEYIPFFESVQNPDPYES
jgi:hypothetical protein